MDSILGDQRESKERRLTPEFVERFFVDGFQYIGGRLSPGQDQDWKLDSVPADLRSVLRSYNTGEFGAENRLITFRKERLRRDPSPEFVAPDHPLFDAVLERILEQGRPTLAMGTVFVDKETTEPYLVWLLEAAVVNGAGQVVHKRLLGLRQRGTALEPISPAALLDLPPGDVVPAMPASLRALADGDRAVSEASRMYSTEYLTEVTGEQERQSAIVERALQQSINDSLTDLQTRLERQHEDQTKGRDMALAIRNTNDQIDQLTKDLRQRRSDLQRRRVTSIQTPRVVGVAAVVPGLVPRAVEDGLGGDNTVVEMAAMTVVMNYEISQNRKPTDVSRLGVGYDIKSGGPGEQVRYIEVKGHRNTGDVTLYYTEWLMAHRMREEFYIYEVNYTTTKPEVWITQDPVGKGIEPTERVVEYHISAGQLKPVAVLAVQEGIQ